jgi:hypothetical protein
VRERKRRGIWDGEELREGDTGLTGKRRGGGTVDIEGSRVNRRWWRWSSRQNIKERIRGVAKNLNQYRNISVNETNESNEMNEMNERSTRAKEGRIKQTETDILANPIQDDNTNGIVGYRIENYFRNRDLGGENLGKMGLYDLLILISFNCQSLLLFLVLIRSIGV